MVMWKLEWVRHVTCLAFSSLLSHPSTVFVSVFMPLFCLPPKVAVFHSRLWCCREKNSKKHFGILRDKRHDTREVCRCRRVPSGVCVGTAAEHKLTCLPDSRLALFTSVFADFRGLRNLAYFVTNIYQVRLVQRKAYCFQTGRRA